MMTEAERLLAEAREECRCWHPRSDHTGEGEACEAPTSIVGYGAFSPTPCTCERFRYPDSDD
jgi:hypothetical protein